MQNAALLYGEAGNMEAQLLLEPTCPSCFNMFQQSLGIFPLWRTEFTMECEMNTSMFLLSRTGRRSTSQLRTSFNKPLSEEFKEVDSNQHGKGARALDSLEYVALTMCQ